MSNGVLGASTKVSQQVCLESALKVAPREALVVHELVAFLVHVRTDPPAAYKVPALTRN